jgi:PEP-CTERM motif
MRPRFKHVVVVAFITLGMLIIPSAANADIAGFGNFSQFTINQNDSGSPPTVPSAGVLELVNGDNEFRSVFADTPQHISQFTASFTYQVPYAGTFGAFPGATFIVENDSRGAAAVGATVNDSDAFTGINDSVGIIFDLASNTTGLFTDGNVTSGAANVSPVNLLSGDPIDVQLAYNGTSLTETLVDTVTSAQFSTTDLVLTSIPTTVGGSTAYVGLAADGPADQYFSNFDFTSGVPEPSGLGLLGAGAVAALRRRRRSI